MAKRVFKPKTEEQKERARVARRLKRDVDGDAVRLADKIYRDSHRETIRAQEKARRLENPELYSARQKRAYEKRKALGLPRIDNRTAEDILFKEAKRRVRKSNLECNIDVSDVIIPALCPILGIPLFKAGGKTTPNSPSLDRVNNNLGYIKGNIRVISHRANAIKSVITLELLHTLEKYMKGEI